LQGGEQGTAQQGDHGLEVLAVVGHHQFCIRGHGGAKAGHQIPGQGGAVTGDEQHPVVAGGGKTRQHPGQRSLEVGMLVADDGGKLPVAILAAVGIDQHLVHLGAQALEHVFDQGPARKGLPALVVAPHAGGTATGQDDGGNGKCGGLGYAHGAPGGEEGRQGAGGILRQARRRSKPLPTLAGGALAAGYG